MQLTYLYHSCFVVESNRFTLIFDYYKDSHNKWLQKHFLNLQGPVYVFASHAHPDHFEKEVLSWKLIRNDIRYILSRDILKEGQCSSADGFFLEKRDVFQDEFLYVKAFGSTDQGVSFYVEAEGKKIFHAGDLNNWHWKEESTTEEIADAETAFYNELESISKAVNNLDVLMFPLDPRLGKDFGSGADQFMQHVKTRILVPMHCQGEYELVNRFAESAALYGSQYFAVEKEEDAINI